MLEVLEKIPNAVTFLHSKFQIVSVIFCGRAEYLYPTHALWTRFDWIRTRKPAPFLKNSRAGPRCTRGRLARQLLPDIPKLTWKLVPAKKKGAQGLKKHFDHFVIFRYFLIVITLSAYIL